MIRDSIGRIPAMAPLMTGVVFNRVDGADTTLKEKALSSGLLYYGNIRPDPVISEMDRLGLSIMGIPESASSLIEMRAVLNEIGIL